jgi:hypothetical protein
VIKFRPARTTGFLGGQIESVLFESYSLSILAYSILNMQYLCAELSNLLMKNMPCRPQYLKHCYVDTDLNVPWKGCLNTRWHAKNVSLFISDLYYILGPTSNYTRLWTCLQTVPIQRCYSLQLGTRAGIRSLHSLENPFSSNLPFSLRLTWEPVQVTFRIPVVMFSIQKLFAAAFVLLASQSAFVGAQDDAEFLGLGATCK